MEQFKKSNIDITILEKGKFTVIRLLRILVTLILLSPTVLDLIQ